MSTTQSAVGGARDLKPPLPEPPRTEPWGPPGAFLCRSLPSLVSWGGLEPGPDSPTKGVGEPENIQRGAACLHRLSEQPGAFRSLR